MAPLSPHAVSLSQHISSIPKLDKALFVVSYIQEQRANLKAHALEGLALALSWNRESENSHQPLSRELQAPAEYGFGTPVLKARVRTLGSESGQHVPTVGHFAEKNSPSDSQEEKKCKEPSVKRKRSVSPARRIKPKSKPQRRKSPRPSVVADSDEEHAGRLKERRDKKRTKRAIIEPPLEKSDAEQESGLHETERKGKRNKGVKNKVPAGFALMHGFSATNVGSGRLTVKPSLNTGVFNKGKASHKTRVMRKTHSTKGHHTFGFSEIQFLNKTRKERTKPTSDDRSSTSSTSGQRSGSLPVILDIQKKSGSQRYKANSNTELHKTKKIKEVKNVGVSIQGSGSRSVTAEDRTATSCLQKTVQKAISPVESLVWDIELDGVILSSQLLESESGDKSILLHTRHHGWSGIQADEPRMDSSHASAQSPRKPASLKLDKYKSSICSSPSIGPSQSASQPPRPTPFRQESVPIKAASKYFATAPLIDSEEKSYATPIEPAKSAIKSITTPIYSQHQPRRVPSNHDLSSFCLVPVPTNQVATVSTFPVDVAENELKKFRLNSSTASFEQMSEVSLRDYRYSEGEPQFCRPDYHLDGSADLLPTIICDDTVDPGSYHHASCNIQNGSYYSSFDEWPERINEFDEDQCAQEINLHCFEHMPFLSGEEDMDLPGEYNFEFDSKTQDWESQNLDVDKSSIYTCDHLEAYCEEEPCGTNWMDVDLEVSELSSLLDDSTELTRDERTTFKNTGAIFSQGRNLLLSYFDQAQLANRPSNLLREPVLSLVEADVVKGLRDHWLPQRLS